MKIKMQRLSLVSLFFFFGWALIAAGHAMAAEAQISQDVQYEAGFYYTVQKGDTLWDLSQRFSDSPWQWPDLWRENKQLPNPHWIYPGERIRLFRKSDQHRQETPATPAAPRVESAPPADLPPLQVDYMYSSVDRVGFIRKPAVQSVGIIFKSEDDKKLISENDLVYVRHPDNSQTNAFRPGTRFTVYKTRQPNNDSDALRIYGDQHYFLGVVEIVKSDREYAIAKVMKSFNAISVGDLLMPYEARQPTIPVVDSTPGIKGQIIASEEQTRMMGDRFIAFIDKGTDDRILPGQVYTIQQEQSVRTGGRSIVLEPVTIGSLLVLRTEKNTSTVIITDSRRAIEPGQPISTP
jgi:hypothetical protein